LGAFRQGAVPDLAELAPGENRGAHLVARRPQEARAAAEYLQDRDGHRTEEHQGDHDLDEGEATLVRHPPHEPDSGRTVTRPVAPSPSMASRRPERASTTQRASRPSPRGENVTVSTLPGAERRNPSGSSTRRAAAAPSPTVRVIVALPESSVTRAGWRRVT